MGLYIILYTRALTCENVWQELADDQGEPYYYNSVDDSACWEHPSTLYFTLLRDQVCVYVCLCVWGGLRLFAQHCMMPAGDTYRECVLCV